jgi:hypothetical protein
MEYNHMGGPGSGRRKHKKPAKMAKIGAMASRSARHKPVQFTVASYVAGKSRTAIKLRNASAAARDIGPLPGCKHPRRRARCAKSLIDFAQTYMPNTFSLPSSDMHITLANRLELVLRDGGQYAVALPRGSGKSSWCLVGLLWASLYGLRKYLVLIGPSQDHATEMLAAYRTELDTNDLLLEDFPEACHPVRCLDGLSNRCRGQLIDGARTRIIWSEKTIMLPAIKGAVSAGVRVQALGITGRLRGLRATQPDGTTIRPDVVVIDDPQTNESAASAQQCQHRERIIMSDILGLAGPGKAIAAILPCTVIRPDDLADTLLNTEKHPEWNGQRIKMLITPPTNQALWDQYAEIWGNSLREHNNISLATEFYAKNRAAMDMGAAVSWEARYNKDELSAIQAAQNLKLRDELAFYSEYQNDPAAASQFKNVRLVPANIIARYNGQPRNAIPPAVTHLTAFVDIHDTALFYLVAGWCSNLSGFVVDYGTFPEQPIHNFTLTSLPKPLTSIYPGVVVDGAIHAGLTDLLKQLTTRFYDRNGVGVRLDRIHVDAGYKPAIVEQVLARLANSSIRPARGVGITADKRPISQYTKHPGDIIGDYWYLPAAKRSGGPAIYLIDVNHYKAKVYQGLLAPMGQAGAISMYGTEQSNHTMLVNQLCSEYPIEKSGKYGHGIAWTQKLNSQNHLFDCLVGALAAAACAGLVDPHGGGVPVVHRKRYTQADVDKRTGRRGTDPLDRGY